MDDKIIVAIVSALSGWFLSAINSGYSGYINRKKLLGILLVKLIKVENHTKKIILSSEKIKDFCDGWEQYEKVRANVFSRHFLEPNDIIENLKVAINNIAPYYPLLSINLEAILEGLLNNKKATLMQTSKIPGDKDLYIKLLSTHEVGLELSQRELRKIISTIALKHGYYTFIKRIIDLRKEKKIIENYSNIIDFLDLDKLK
ncbi:hypothetical protein ACRS9C_07310 [Serratia marcescens]|uniref:hypothetical protein n=1 Tax=Serratia marcescens TaxID=615 RepID=UPI001BD5E622|nr:hypothetical protein [Serratia marcescens]